MTDDDTDDAIAETMIQLGGSFVSMLGQLFLRADAVNRIRLKHAFPDYWERYAALAGARARGASPAHLDTDDAPTPQRGS